MDLDSKWNNTFEYPDGLIKTVHRGICPEGWHIPTEAERDSLMYRYGSSDKAHLSKGIRSGNMWVGAENETGLSILPTGIYYNDVGKYNLDGEKVLKYEFTVVGEEAEFWTAQKGGWLFLDDRMTYGWSYSGNHGLSVRCIED